MVFWKYFAKFTGKHLCQGIFLNKVAGLTPITLLKKTLWHRCFPVNFENFIRKLFFTQHLRWLLLFEEQYFYGMVSIQSQLIPTIDSNITSCYFKIQIYTDKEQQQNRETIQNDIKFQFSKESFSKNNNVGTSKILNDYFQSITDRFFVCQ